MRRQQLPDPPQQLATTPGTSNGFFGDSNDLIDPATSPEPAETPNPGQYLARVLRSDNGVLTAAVLLPNTTDLKGTAYTAETIKRAMDGFTQSPKIGIEHKGKPLSSGVTHLASWQTDQDQEFDGNQLPAGTWMMSLLVSDPELWQKVESGEINGLSIQGTAQVEDPDFENDGGGGDIGKDIGEAVRLLLEAASKYRYSSTQVNLSYGLSDRVRDFGRQLISEDDLHENGREHEPHITVKYGLHTSSSKPVIDILRGEPAISGELGQTDVFEAPDFDVVHLKVHSPDLHRLNRSLSALPHTDTHPDYHPHVTLAYVKRGAGAKYKGRADLEGTPFTADTVTFSGRTGDRDFAFLRPNQVASPDSPIAYASVPSPL